MCGVSIVESLLISLWTWSMSHGPVMHQVRQATSCPNTKYVMCRPYAPYSLHEVPLANDQTRVDGWGGAQCNNHVPALHCRSIRERDHSLCTPITVYSKSFALSPWKFVITSMQKYSLNYQHKFTIQKQHYAVHRFNKGE